MKNVTLPFLLFFLALFFSNAQHTLTVKVTNLKTDKGIVRLQLLDANHKLVTKGTGLVEKDETNFTLEKIPSGYYENHYYHDENSNDQLDTNMIGIPTKGMVFLIMPTLWLDPSPLLIGFLRSTKTN